MFRFSSDNTPTKFVLGSDSYNPVLEIAYTVLPDSIANPLSILDPVSSIPVSENDLGYYLTLPRLTPKTPEFINTVASIEVTINRVDYTKCFDSFDATYPLNGSTIGTLKLIEVYPFDLDSIAIEGDEVIITLNSDKYYFRVINTPKYYEDNEAYKLDINLGDELELFSNSIRIKPKYCGAIPDNSGAIATLYAQLLGLRTIKSMPYGHIIKDKTDGFNMALANESIWDYLSSLYAPIDYDVRTAFNGQVEVKPRPYFDIANSLSINAINCITVESLSGNFEPLTRIKVSNNYSIIKPLTIETKTFRSITGDASNTKPFFQNGYQETLETHTYLGDTLIYKKVENWGYVPTDAQPWNNSQVNPGVCETGFTSTVFQLIATKTDSVTYSAYYDSYLIDKEEYWDRGLELVESSGSYTLVNRLNEYRIKTYFNRPQPSISVCKKDYIHLSLRIREDVYKIVNDVFSHYSFDDISYTLVGSSITDLDAYSGVGDVWNSINSKGEYDSNAGKIITQPIVENLADPPNARVISPKTENYINYFTYSLGTDTRITPNTVDAPFCYDLEQLETFARRYLLEQYGLSNSIQIELPYTHPAKLGSSIRFTDSKGVTKNYVVHHLEINASDKVTKTLTLLGAL